MSQPASFGKYQVVRELGQGSMGIVYEGYDAEIDRRVALKTVRSSGFSAEQLAELVARLRREARAVGRLHHTNIVALYELGEASVPAEDGSSTKTPYLAMEFIEGQELRSYFSHGERLPIGEVVRIMTELLGALEYAHSNGVVHRDIKPSNIVLTKTGTVKLADFGIARMEWTTRYTQMGWVIGTPSYMPPEQFRGENVDLRADLYAAGALLYELLTGRVPFEGEITTVMYKVLHETPAAPSIVNKDLPPAFDSIVLRAMAKQPEARYQSAAEFRAAIAAATSSQNQSQSPGDAATLAAAGAALEKTTIRSSGRPVFWRRASVRYALVLVLLAAVAGGFYFELPRLRTSPEDSSLVARQKASALESQAALRSLMDEGGTERRKIAERVTDKRTLTHRFSAQVDSAKNDSERQEAERSLERARRELEIAEKARLITEAHLFAATSVSALQAQQMLGESELGQGHYDRALNAFNMAQDEARKLDNAVRSVEPALQAQQDLAARMDLARRIVAQESGDASTVLADSIKVAAQAGGMLDEGQPIAALRKINAANASIRDTMSRFLEYLVKEYATIAQREMSAHRLDVAKAAIERGKSLRALEQQFQ
jgi:tRNA A-37 threonylcarbamoyl transferase component Bud32/tetratricopeptide (TPR) repeat protein